MQTLLIWNHPEEVELYLIDDPPEWLEKIHGHLLNVTEDPEVDALLVRVCDAISTRLEWCENKNDELATTWADKELTGDLPHVFYDPIRVVVSGWWT